MAMNQTMGPGGFSGARVRPMRDHWLLSVFEGVLLVGLGAVAIMVPQFATLSLTVLLGWVFLISGGVGLVTTLWARHAPGYSWSLISALLGIGVGLVLLAWPISGAVSLTLLLAVFFAVEGLASVMYAFEHRRQLSGRSGWMFASGIVALILSALIFNGLPGTAEWVLGLLVGINMTIGGLALVAMSLHARTPSSGTGADVH
jgi:uncharacterized membrane protein HdeD (DUF308 family)